MDTIRHRKKMSDTELERPLLEKNEGLSLNPSTSSRPPTALADESKKLISYSGPFNLSSFLSSIFSCWRRIFEFLLVCFSRGATIFPELSPQQLECLQRIKAKATESFDSNNSQHQELLKQLWIRAFPEMPFANPKSEQWKEMGWQGVDPATDIRGAGCLGLDCLLYLADKHPAIFMRLLNKLDGQRSDWEYPFAVAGLNISFMLLEVIGLQSAGTASSTSGEGLAAAVNRTPAGRGFAMLIAINDCAFQELFVMVFERLDKEWLSQGASYMQFGQVMKAVKAQVERTLSSNCKTMEQVRAKLG
ncbi:hypothetical protein CEUSTIGMA_g9838.t1 [Chlamydomonas eustigma]|uniref:ELMO domain-containing protein n=1 Tax=Chlamydomonas eustigma TaxID=1157962 RepID=A0A250XHY2_9CHLO|nr:hypothetical protein CEUSTIGMA_g9838.t1 [Chlamydomonas eustigma]|eukprot:GAX82410.1 hypothetical protein CEUSTIGMA_g9838.t1 [Chlamydomonas eustigma]